MQQDLEHESLAALVLAIRLLRFKYCLNYIFSNIKYPRSFFFKIPSLNKEIPAYFPTLIRLLCEFI